MAGLGITVDFDAQIGSIESEIKKINASFNKFDADARRVSQNVSKSFQLMESSAKSVRNIALSFAGGLGFAAISKEVLDTNRSMEALRAQLKAIEGSSRGAERTFRFISDFATNTPFEIQGLTDTYIKLQNFGIEPTEKVMAALTNQAAKLGGSQETLSGITLALGQAYAKGKLQAEEMNQLIERGVPIYKILADVTGQSGEALQDMAKNGELSATVIDKVIDRMGELAKGSNAAAMDTLNGKISNLADSWTRFQDVLLNDKSEGFIKNFVGGIGNIIDGLTAKMDNSVEAQIKQATERLKELEAFRANSSSDFVGNPVTDQRIQEQGKLLDMLKEQKRQQDIVDNSAKAIAETWKWVDEADSKTQSINKALSESGQKIKTIDFNPAQLEKSEQIIKRLRTELQLTREQAAGVVGNLFQESGLNTSAVSKDGFGSIGIAQWTDRGESFRKTALEGYAKGAGKLPTDIEAQIGFLINELLTTERRALDRLRNTSGVSDAALSFRQAFERPDPAKANDQTRIAAANTAFLGGLTESEVKNAQALQEKTLKEQQDWAERYKAVYTSLYADIQSQKLPELQRNIADKTSEVLKQAGLDTDNLTEAQLRQKAGLVDLVQQYFFLQERTKLQTQSSEEQIKKYNEVTEAYKELEGVLNSVVDNEKFTEVLTHWKDLLGKGAITTDEFTKNMGALAVEFNKSTDAIKNSTDQMSEFAVQAARNMQDAFADFLFDPFKDGLGGMADNFASTLQRMVANAASQQIFDAFGIDKILKGGLSGSGFGDAAGSFFSGAADFLSGVFSANGNVFQGGNVVPFANGGIISSPMMFPLRNNRVGIAGEAGAEAIMPLRRDSSGRLGVAMSGNQGGSTVININQTINVASGADSNRVRQSAGQGLRDALALVNSAGRYR